MSLCDGSRVGRTYFTGNHCHATLGYQLFEGICDRSVSAPQMDPALRGVTPLEGRHVPKIKGLAQCCGISLCGGGREGELI